MYRLVAATALTLLATFPQAHAGTKIEDSSKNCPFEVSAPIGVGPYVSVFGGANIHQTGDLDTSSFNWDLESNRGWFTGLKAGYTFNSHSFILPSVELEGFYNRVDYEQTGSDQFRYDSEFFQYSSRLDGKYTADVHMAAIMLNGLLRFDLGRFRPYIGGGIGVAHTWFEDGKLESSYRSEFRSEYFSDSFSEKSTSSVRNLREWSFAAQGIAGLEILATDRIGIFAEYKALWLRDAVFVKDYIHHLVGGGIRLYF